MDVNDILIFVRVAQAGSFSQAARLMGMPVSTVSRRVADLESRLRVPLLVRTTRSLKITEIGRAYLEHGLKIAAELEQAEALATNLQSIPQGTLKITATPDFGHQFLRKIVSDFLRDYPLVRVDLVLTDRVVDLIEEGFDLAIRIGELEDSSLRAKKIGSMDLQLYASPRFLKTHGEPQTVSDLAKFDCIRFTAVEDSDVWRLKGPKREIAVKVSGRVLSNDMELIRDFVVAGEGIALMPDFFCAKESSQGNLKVILNEWTQPSGPIHAVYPSQKHVLPKVKKFIERLTF